MSLFDARREYGKLGLNESDLHADPIEQFARWFKQAVDANEGEWFEPNAMTLATVTPDGKPSARIVLLKDFGPAGFTFFTNYESRKGQELAANPHAALVFHWSHQERQVRVEGTATKVSREESETYFHSRPRGSQLGAVISCQSQVITSRKVLEDQLAALTKQYGDDQRIPMPDNWGGYRVAPHTLEFWQGRPNRLHDRLMYTRQADDRWTITRLAP